VLNFVKKYLLFNPLKLRGYCMYLQVEICALLGYYKALSDSSVPTFRVNVSVQYSRDQQVVLKRRYRSTTQRFVISQKSADLICIAAEA
jgi:hypothetical protein